MICSAPIKFERVFLDADIENHPLVRDILERIGGLPVTRIFDRRNFRKEIAAFSISQGKRNLWLTRFEGAFLKRCPGTQEPYVCCNYWVINLQVNCPLDCSYCILQDYLNLPLVRIFVNLDKIPEEIEVLQKTYPNRLLRIGTGELSDSLVLDPLTRANEQLIQFVSDKPMFLEFKTKTSNTSHLPRLRRRNVVISCSVNPEDIVRSEEFKTASLGERLQALGEAVKKGYRAGLHFDPIIECVDWGKKYEETIQRITDSIGEEDVAWISLGALRFPPQLKRIIDERFPRSRAGLGEFVPCPDGKMRYFRPIRTEFYQRIYAAIRERWRHVFIYFCMEHPSVWKQVMGYCPDNNNHLDFLFHENAAQRFPDLGLLKPDQKNYGIGDF